jgi:hypothetical protein
MLRLLPPPLPTADDIEAAAAAPPSPAEARPPPSLSRSCACQSSRHVSLIGWKSICGSLLVEAQRSAAGDDDDEDDEGFQGPDVDIDDEHHAAQRGRNAIMAAINRRYGCLIAAAAGLTMVRCAVSRHNVAVTFIGRTRIQILLILSSSSWCCCHSLFSGFGGWVRVGDVIAVTVSK